MGFLSKHGELIVKQRFSLQGESHEQTFWRVCLAFSDDEAMAGRLMAAIERKWWMPATPVISNAPTRLKFADDFSANFQPYLFKKHSKGLPISCFLNYVPDTVSGLIDHTAESRFLSIAGGGIGAYWGDVRSTSRKSPGPIPFLKTHDADVLAYHQGAVRRGAYAAYMPIDHPDIVEFISIRKPTGGDPNRKCLNLHHGVCIPDWFMELVERAMYDAGFDDTYELVDPHDGRSRGSVSAREIWQLICETRHETGEPYLFFTDAVNRAFESRVDPKTAKSMLVYASNLCAEIVLPTGPDYTAVCCLSSLNADKFDEWQGDSWLVADVVRFLDNVLEYFVHNASEYYNNAVRSVLNERSIGLGLMGFHSYLQRHGVPFDSPMAIGYNKRLFKTINERAYAASKALADERGAAPAAATHRRNTHLIAIAPNATTANLLGVSPGIEPWRANAFVQKTDSGALLIKNPHLENILIGKGLDADAILHDVAIKRGSVAACEFLTDQEKQVFKTAVEIDQRAIIDLAADRQRFICQSQSLNLFLPSDASIAELHHMHYRAWKKGLKTMYYLRSEAPRSAETMGDGRERKKIDIADTECFSCEG